MARRRQRHSAAQLQLEFITRAVEAVSELERKTIFVKVDRIKHRKNRFRPTEHQSRLLAWIRRQGFVSNELCEGMNFMTLGLLKAKRLVVEVKENGVEGIRAV